MIANCKEKNSQSSCHSIENKSLYQTIPKMMFLHLLLRITCIYTKAAAIYSTSKTLAPNIIGVYFAETHSLSHFRISHPLTHTHMHACVRIVHIILSQQDTHERVSARARVSSAYCFHTCYTEA